MVCIAIDRKCPEKEEERKNMLSELSSNAKNDCIFGDTVVNLVVVVVVLIR